MWEGKDSEEKKLANVTIKNLLDRPAKAEHSTRLVPFLNMNTDISLSTISRSTTNIPNEKSSNFLSACVYFRPELDLRRDVGFKFANSDALANDSMFCNRVA